MKFGYVAIVYIIFQMSTGSVSQASEVYRADDLVLRAFEQNPELRAIEFDQKALEARSRQAELWDDPTLDLGFENRNQPGLGDTSGGRVGISQFFNRPGILKQRREVENIQVEKGQLNQALSKIEFQTLILKLIYEYRANVERVVHAQERVKRIETVSTFLSSRPFLSPQVNAQASVLRAKLILLKHQLNESEAQRKVSWFKLNSYLNLAAEPSSVDARWYVKPQIFDREQIKSRAINENPEIRRLAVEFKSANARKQLESLGSWSGFTLSASASNSRGYEPERVYGLGISFPIPVLNGNRENIEASKAEAQSAQIRLDWEKKKSGSQIDAALAKFDAAATSLKLLNMRNLEASEKTMSTIDRDFKKTQVDFVTYFEADQQHFENFNTALEIQIDYLAALSEVLSLTGEAPSASKD